MKLKITKILKIPFDFLLEWMSQSLNWTPSTDHDDVRDKQLQQKIGVNIDYTFLAITQSQNMSAQGRQNTHYNRWTSSLTRVWERSLAVFDLHLGFVLHNYHNSPSAPHAKHACKSTLIGSTQAINELRGRKSITTIKIDNSNEFATAITNARMLNKIIVWLWGLITDKLVFKSVLVVRYDELIWLFASR